MTFHQAIVRCLYIVGSLACCLVAALMGVFILALLETLITPPGVSRRGKVLAAVMTLVMLKVAILSIATSLWLWSLQS